MADNKATALKEANLNTKLKVYYTGETPADSGSFVLDTDILDNKHYPWIIKWYSDKGLCHQYADTKCIYDAITSQLGVVLDAVIVNSKQRDALDKILDNTLWRILREDMAHSNDYVI